MTVIARDERTWRLEGDPARVYQGPPIFPGTTVPVVPFSEVVRLGEQFQVAVEAERAKFHDYLRQYGRLGYDGPHLDHFLATHSTSEGQ